MSKRKLLATVAVVLGLAPAVASAAQPSVTELYFNARVAHSGKCLDVIGGSHDSGVRTVQWPCRGPSGFNQMWRLNPVGDGYYQLVAGHSGKCLDVVGGQVADGAHTQQWQCLNQPNQHWRFEYADSGLYKIVARHSRKCLTVLTGHLEDGAGTYQLPCAAHAVRNQHWTLTST